MTESLLLAERKASITPKKVGRKPVTSDEEDVKYRNKIGF